MRKEWLALILLLGSVPFTGGCGKLCIAGMGDCSVYRNWNTAAPTSNASDPFTLSPTELTVAPRASVTLKVTSNNPRPAAVQCLWELPSGPGGLTPDAQPTVLGALCTAIYKAPAAPGTATVRLTDRTSGTIRQAVITTATP